jgi:hypothetical protein
MKIQPTTFKIALITGAVSAFLGCAGGADTSSTTANPCASSSITTTVMDGLISNALVCLDTNGNSLCDTSEPQGRTDAKGTVTLQALPVDHAKSRLIAMIGTDAVDLDTGPITKAYTLTAPHGKHAVISPLTTMVHAKMDLDKMDLDKGSADVAETFVRTQTGLTVSVYDNFIGWLTNNHYQRN